MYALMFEVAVAYLVWNTPLWMAGAVLGVIFCICYAVLAFLLTLAIIS